MRYIKNQEEAVNNYIRSENIGDVNNLKIKSTNKFEEISYFRVNTQK